MYVSLVAQVMLLCDGCDAPTHLACTQPRLRRVPKGDWFCVACSPGATAAGCAFQRGLITADFVSCSFEGGQQHARVFEEGLLPR